jgi:hypothetical protein
MAWSTQLLGNITRLRAAEAASSNGSMMAGAAVKDIPFSQLFSDWVAASKATWLPQQVPIANALMSINVQVCKHVILLSGLFDTFFGALRHLGRARLAQRLECHSAYGIRTQLQSAAVCAS